MTVKRIAASLSLLLVAACASTAVEHPVGFRIVDLYDKVRAFVPGDYMLGRPLRVRLWYPALPGGNRITMRDYLADRPMSGVPEETWNAIVARDRSGISNPEKPAAATLNASPARQRFPLVIYLPASQEHLDQSVAVAERLASRGFAVAIAPRLGPDPTNPTEPTDELLVEDFRFLARQLRGLADIDEHRIAIVAPASAVAAARRAAELEPTIRHIEESGPSVRQIARSLRDL
jgi:hypothetical protein